MWIDSFIDYLKFEKCYSEHTATSYRNDLESFNLYLEKNQCKCSLEAVTKSEIRGWIIHLMDDGLKSTSVNRKLSTLKSFYKYLQYKKVIAHNPAWILRGPEKEKPLPIFIREEAMEKIFEKQNSEETFSETRNRMIIETFYSTGMRLSELIGLKMKDVDLHSSVFKVTGKRNKQRLIPFGNELEEHLLHYIHIRNKEFGESCCDSFFVLQNGEAMYPSAVYKLVKRELSKVVTLKKRSPHVLRHTFATAMLNHDASLNAVKEILGHESLETTEIYTHTTFEELKKVYNQAHPRA